MFGHLRCDTFDVLKGMIHIRAVALGRPRFTPFQAMHCTFGRNTNTRNVVDGCQWDDFFFSLLLCNFPNYTPIQSFAEVI